MPVKERSEAKKNMLELLRVKTRENESRKNEILNSTVKRINFTARQFLGAYDMNAVLGWRSFLVPTELFYASGVLPFTPEIAAAFLSRNQAGIRSIIETAEEKVYDGKMCSFIKTIAGGTYGNTMPKPDVIVASPSFCTVMGINMEDLSQHYGCDFFYLDLPLEESKESILYVSGQLRKLSELLCRKSGMNFEEFEKNRLPLCIENSNRASRAWDEICKMRMNVPSPMSGREALDYATVLSQGWGSEETAEIYELLLFELKQRSEHISEARNEMSRILWLHLKPYYSDKIFDIIENSGASVVFEEVNYPSRKQMDANDPFLSLAKEVISNGGSYRLPSVRARDIVKVIKDYKIDGIIHFSHDNCDYTKATFPFTYKLVEKEYGLPVLTLNSDCLLDEKSELINTRLYAFLEGLKVKKNSFTKNNQDRNKINDLRSRQSFIVMGIDSGASATKVAVLSINDSPKLLGWAVVPTGADSLRAVDEACNLALTRSGISNLEYCSNIVATGVGRENIPFANKIVTEITCHLHGMKYFLPDVKTIIDIGGQDTKVILADSSKFRMNDACAAGTGKFLSAMAEALGLSLSELSETDILANDSLTMSKMCTVFAESEVVSLIARGKPIGAIVRGIHDMVAYKAVTLLRQVSHDVQFPIAMSGGVALNKGVVRALKSSIDYDIFVPEFPQLVGAIGAAMIGAKQ